MEEFLKKFVEEKNFCTRAVALNSFTKSYLPNINDNIDQKRNYAFNVFPKIPELVAALTQFNNVTSYNAEKEVKVLNLQSATLCLETLLICSECFKTNERLLALLQITLKVLHQSYTHCEMSESLYGDLFEDFTDQLSCFFQKIQDLQTVLVSQIDRLITLDFDNTDDIVSISGDLGKLCKLVSGLDVMSATKLWRAFSKLVTHFSSTVRERLDVNSVLTSLLSNISDINQDCKLKLTNTEKIEESDVKILVFELNQVMKIFHVFNGFLDASIQKLRTLVIELHELLIICHSSEEVRENNIQLLENALISSISPMLALFYSDKSFVMSVLELNSTEISCDYFLPHLFLKLSAFKFLCADDASNLVSTDQRKILFKRMFETLQESKPMDDMLIIALQLPQSLFHGVGAERERSTTLYAELYRCISEFSKTIPDSDFNNLENDVVELLFSSSKVVLLLVSDVWMYRLRCSSIENLMTSCINFSKAIIKMNSNIYLKLLFKRMLKFLPANKMLQLDYNGDLKYIMDDNQKVHHRYGVPQVSRTQVETFINYGNIILLMNEIKKPISNEEQKLVQRAIYILELFSLFVGVCENEDILKFSEFAALMFETEIYEIQIAVLTFLKAMKGKQLSKNFPQFQEAARGFATLLTKVLKSSNYIVRHVALNTYVNIAHTTPHPEIIRDIVIKAPELMTVIKSYFSKIPPTEFLSEIERMKNLQAQIHTHSIQKEPRRIFANNSAILFQLK